MSSDNIQNNKMDENIQNINLVNHNLNEKVENNINQNEIGGVVKNDLLSCFPNFEENFDEFNK